MTESLCHLFPESASLFQERSNHLIQELKALDQETAQQLQSVHGDAILVSHPAFGYYCRDYDLIQISVECEGKDPKPQDIKRVLADARKYHVTSILLQKQYNNRGTEAIAKDLNISVHEFDPYAFDYFTNMKILNTLVAHENSH
jgi:zinc transport system substrate-binding protein